MKNHQIFNIKLNKSEQNILNAALNAVNSKQAIFNFVILNNNILTIKNQNYDLDNYQNILILGAGKAGASMAQAMEEILGDRLSGGLVVVKYDHQVADFTSQYIEIIEAAHPIPDRNGLIAGTKILEIAKNASKNDLVIVLISGGGSALLEALPADISLADLQQINQILQACGATIQELNCIRKHCSLIKGGQLAKVISPATQITLVLSDVLGSPLDAIASGPTVPDLTSWQDAWQIIEKYNLEKLLPLSLLKRIENGLNGVIEDTPKQNHPVFSHNYYAPIIIADLDIAATAAQKQAEIEGYHSLIVTTQLEGEAKQVAQTITALAKQQQQNLGQLPTCLIWGGETTVNLQDISPAKPGIGGRNQELALAGALFLQGTRGIKLITLATDGTDGPTNEAGGVVDGNTVTEGKNQGLEAETYLSRHDAYNYLATIEALIHTGPTLTNVNDLVFGFIYSEN